MFTLHEQSWIMNYFLKVYLMLYKEIFENWYKNNMIDLEFNSLNTNDINNIFRCNLDNSGYKEKPVQSAYRGFIGGIEHIRGVKWKTLKLVI